MRDIRKGWQISRFLAGWSVYSTSSDTQVNWWPRRSRRYKSSGIEVVASWSDPNWTMKKFCNSSTMSFSLTKLQIDDQASRTGRCIETVLINQLVSWCRTILVVTKVHTQVLRRWPDVNVVSTLEVRLNSARFHASIYFTSCVSHFPHLRAARRRLAVVI